MSVITPPAQKTLILGTALWGWGITRTDAFQLLDRFAALGGTTLDTAINYPINQRKEDFGLALSWAADWIATNGSDALSVLLKLGAIDNMGSSNTNLRSTYLRETVAVLQQDFCSALSVLAIHWDNRGDATGDEEAIADTLQAMTEFHQAGLGIGFSGIKHPELYRKLAPDLVPYWWIQVKENALTHTAREHYSSAFPQARYIAYGINMGGLKSESCDKKSDDRSSVTLRGLHHPHRLAEQLTQFIHSAHGLTPAPSNFNELALLMAYFNPSLSGIIIGPRNLTQLNSSMNYWQRLQSEIGVNTDASWHKLQTLALSIQAPPSSEGRHRENL